MTNRNVFNGQFEQQTSNARRVHRTRGGDWRPRASDFFDYDAAIEGVYRVFDRVYGKRWRRGLRSAR